VDGIFLAAALTIIGLSINDTVVVFDRVRERLRRRDRQPFDKMVNDATLQTVPRTINTGLGAMFILATLVILGGKSLTDFSLALLVGLVVGTLSSVFLASPLVVLLERRWPDAEAFTPAADADDVEEVEPMPTVVRTAGTAVEDGGSYAGTVTVARPATRQSKDKRPRDKYAKADPYADIGDGRDIPDEDAPVR
jgi:predicted RND superfamily exporter protein